MFENIYGHDRVKSVLARMIEKDRLHHGLCFYGPSGIGKRLTAFETARAMLCLRRTGCGECPHCRKLLSGNHPDYLEVRPDGADIKVHQIREIAENLHYRPFEGRARMVVLDGVERMREEAANAFLKSLEEPPGYVYFILVTADLKALLPTIRSRCQKIAFQSLTREDKAAILVKRFGKDETLAFRLASISFRQLETEEEAWQGFTKDVETCLSYFQMMFDQGHALDLFSEIVRDKAAFPRFQDHLMATVRAMNLLAQGLPVGALFDDFGDKMKPLAERCAAKDWRELWEGLLRVHEKRRHNLNQALWFNATSVAGLGLLEASERQLKQRLGLNR